MSRSRLKKFAGSRAALTLALVSTLCASATGMAAEATATAVLDNSETVLGQPVQLQIKVTGSASATPPQEIAVDGLEIHYAGDQRETHIEFGSRGMTNTTSVIHTYTVMPLRAGTFKIPSQAVRVGNTSMRTPELTLNVADAAGRSSRGARRNETTDPAQIGFVELILAKTTAYVGEMIPTEIRLGFYTRTPVESLGNGVELTGQGFTTQKMREPRQTIETIRGRSYQVFTFKTAIAPARSGKIDIGPVEVNPVVRIPQTNARRALPRDPFNLNDPFFDNFFNDPAFAPSAPREIKIKSEAAALEVKPLPPNAPPSFAGAVGSFTMVADAKPTSAQVGDPLTITAKISGRGNFDRVTAPSFEDEKGWHKYPPSSQFKQDDDVGISGLKTFETVLSANERKENVPALLFSYFDPVKEQYVTLRSDRIAVHIEGGNVPAPSTAGSPANPSSVPAQTPATTPASKTQDILYQLTELPKVNESFRPLFARRLFWLVQLIPLLGLLGFIVWKLREIRLGDREAQRIALLENEAAELQKKLRHTDALPRDYFSAASRVVQLKTALAKNVNPNSVDAESAATAFNADEPTRKRLRELFAVNDELRYSGGQNGASTVSADRRREVLDLLERLRI